MKAKVERQQVGNDAAAGNDPAILQNKLPRGLNVKKTIATAQLPWVAGTAETLERIRELIPASVACRYKIIPIGREGKWLRIAIANLDDAAILDEIRWVLDAEILPQKAEPEEIEEGLRLIYGVGAGAVDRILEGDADTPFVDLTSTASVLDESDEEASIAKFVNEIFLQALRERSTDIHIEPFEYSLRIRYRVDGVLYEIPVPDSLRHLHPAIVSRIKIMASLNIAEQRLPQDGRIKARTGNRELDLRISILPTPFGEAVNVRILNNNQISLGLQNLGLARHDMQLLEKLIQKPHGIILVTGPTGSGKTTTLYSCLNRLNETQRKIITIEDPIEYQLAGITQIQVNPKIGLTFAQGLRSMLRHDPDVMLVGEIRDQETAEVTIQVAMTGHLVFSTLHTNDAPSAIARLINMGIEPYLIAASVDCIIAQRLVRVICPNCKAALEQADANARLSHSYLESKAIIYRGSGCELCKNTGYFGRTAIYEFLVVDDEIREHIVKKTPANRLRQIAMSKGMLGLRQDGLNKIQRGITTIDEVLRVTQELES